MMIPGPIDAIAFMTGGIIGLYAYNVFAFGVYVSGDIGMWDAVGHPTGLQEQALEFERIRLNGFCDTEDLPWWC